MTKRLPATAPAPRVVYYPDPTPRPLVVYTGQELARQRAEQALQYAQWRTRFDAIQERDRSMRRLLIRLAIAACVVAVGVLAVIGWFVYHTLTSVSSGTVAHSGEAILGVLALLAVIGGGCGCITIVEHRH
jgi:cell division septal protein FtsQ